MYNMTITGPRIFFRGLFLFSTAATSEIGKLKKCSSLNLPQNFLKNPNVNHDIMEHSS